MISKKLLVTITVSTLSISAFSQKELQPKQLNVFKNGTYFVVKEGTVSPKNNVWMMEMKQNPLLSTFWLTTTKDNEINRIDYKMDTIKTTRKVGSFIDLVNANQGKPVTLTYSMGNLAGGQTNIVTLNGTIDKFYKSTNMIKMKVGNEYKFINGNSLMDIAFKENPKDDLKNDSLARVAKVTFGKSKDNQAIKLSYMQSGISWIPSYNIKIIDDGKLQLEMKALVENYSEEMKDVDLTLTLGAANFKYGTQVDPIANMYYTGGNTNYNNYNQYGYGGYVNPAAYQTYSNTLATGAMSYDIANEETSYNYNNYNTYTTSGDKTNDLYMYKLGKVSLPMNTKSSFSIFSTNLPYEEIYEASLYDQVNYASNASIQNRDDIVIPVYHSLKITNNTTYPFTTAPVFVQDKNLQPLAQDQVKYTPIGDKVKVQLAQSPDVKIKTEETEVSSEEKSKKYNNYYYKKVIIKGEIKVQNMQPKSAKVNVTKSINGDITVANNSGEIKKSGQYSGVNPQSNCEWNITLAANEKKTLEYTYTVYIYQGY